MDIRNIPSEVDLKLNLLCGDELTADRITIKPLTIRDIKNMGYYNYSKFLNIITIDKKSITGDDPDFDGISLIDIVVQSKNETLIDGFSNAMAAFLREEVKDVLVNEEMGLVFGGMDFDRDPKTCNIINSSNFFDFIQIIKYQNCLIDAREPYQNKPANEKAQRILDKIKKGKEAVEKAKSSANSNENQIDLSDIISAVSTKSNTYNKNNIWECTIYQLYDEYKRLEAISSYEINIAAMLQGVKVDDLKHWSAKID